MSGRGSALSWPLFRLVTVAAISSADLLVRDYAGRVLLAWREDPFRAGWHVPRSSIIRHREEIGHCMSPVHAPSSAASCRWRKARRIVSIFDDRGHCVSLCHRAALCGVPGRRVPSEDQAFEPWRPALVRSAARGALSQPHGLS